MPELKPAKYSAYTIVHRDRNLFRYGLGGFGRNDTPKGKVNDY